MTDTKLGKAFKQYVDTMSRMVEWIIVLIISQNLFSLGLLFYGFLFFSGVSILLAIIIMYVISTEADIELYSAMLSQTSSTEEFDTKYMKRLGKLIGF